MWVVVWLAVAIAYLIAVLSVPIGILGQLEVHEKPEFRIRLTWLFGLLKKDIRKKKKPPKEKPAKKKKKKPKRGGAGRKLLAVYRVLRTKGMLNHTWRLIKAVLRSFKIKELRVNFRVGLDNPADTAFMVGIFNFIPLFWKPSFPHELNVRPDYDGDVTLAEGYALVRIRVLPVRIIAVVLRFLFSWRTIKVIRIMVAAR